MPAPMLHLGATVLCSHAGTATPTTPFPRVLLSGQPALTQATQHVVAGCALASGGSPPCVTGMWPVGAARVLAGGTPVLTMAQAASSTCVPTATPLMAVQAQARVLAT